MTKSKYPGFWRIGFPMLAMNLKTRLVGAVAVALLFCSASNVLARDIYVSGRTGNDRNTGRFNKDTGTMDGPVRTISRALELVKASDRIIIDPKGGPYRESLTLFGKKASGSILGPLIIEGCGAILEGSDPLPRGIWQHYRDDIYRFQLTMQPVNMTYFHILNGDQVLEKVEVPPDATSIPELETDSWCIFKGFLYFRVKKDKTPTLSPEYQLFYSARTTGISMVQVDEIRIHDLTVQGFQIDGISAANGAQKIVLDNVVCRANGASGLHVGGASSVYAGYCEFIENHSTQVTTKSHGKGHLYDCALQENGTVHSDSDSSLILEKMDEQLKNKGIQHTILDKSAKKE